MSARYALQMETAVLMALYLSINKSCSGKVKYLISVRLLLLTRPQQCWLSTLNLVGKLRSIPGYPTHQTSLLFPTFLFSFLIIFLGYNSVQFLVGKPCMSRDFACCLPLPSCVPLKLLLPRLKVDWRSRLRMGYSFVTWGITPLTYSRQWPL
jgi:hypothetical protein